jgi:hypothetical protein
VLLVDSAASGTLLSIYPNVVRSLPTRIEGILKLKMGIWGVELLIRRIAPHVILAHLFTRHSVR